MIDHFAKQPPLLFSKSYMMSVHETIKFCVRIFSYINAEGTVKRCQPLVGWSLTWYTRFGRLSNTSHRYRRSILITETYSMHNIDFLAPYTVKLTNIVSYSTVFWLQSLTLLCNFGGTPVFWNPAGHRVVCHACAWILDVTFLRVFALSNFGLMSLAYHACMPWCAHARHTTL